MSDLRSIPALPHRTLAALVAGVADANVRGHSMDGLFRGVNGTKTRRMDTTRI